MSFFDFNNAEQQQSYDLIPPKTLAKVLLTIRPGGFDDPMQGWSGGWATQSKTTGSVYLSCEYVVLEGPFAKRKLWSNIGLYSPKGPAWGNRGRSFIRAVLNSAYGIQPDDNSPQAQNTRAIAGFDDLNGLEFVARIDVELDQNKAEKNTIKTVIEPNHKEYRALMGVVPQASSGGSASWSPDSAFDQAPF